MSCPWMGCARRAARRSGCRGRRSCTCRVRGTRARRPSEAAGRAVPLPAAGPAWEGAAAPGHLRRPGRPARAGGGLRGAHDHARLAGAHQAIDLDVVGSLVAPHRSRRLRTVDAVRGDSVADRDQRPLERHDVGAGRAAAQRAAAELGRAGRRGGGEQEGDGKGYDAEAAHGSGYRIGPGPRARKLAVPRADVCPTRARRAPAPLKLQRLRHGRGLHRLERAAGSRGRLRGERVELRVVAQGIVVEEREAACRRAAGEGQRVAERAVAPADVAAVLLVQVLAIVYQEVGVVRQLEPRDPAGGRPLEGPARAPARGRGCTRAPCRRPEIRYPNVGPRWFTKAASTRADPISHVPLGQVSKETRAGSSRISTGASGAEM